MLYYKACKLTREGERKILKISGTLKMSLN